MVFLAKIGSKAPFLTLRSLRCRSGWRAPQVLKSCYNSLHFHNSEKVFWGPCFPANDTMLPHTFGKMCRLPTVLGWPSESCAMGGGHDETRRNSLRRKGNALYICIYLFVIATISMLSSYKPYMGTITIQQVKRSGGVMTAEMTAITTTAWRR